MVPDFPVLEFVFIMSVPIMWFLVLMCWLAQLSTDYMHKHEGGSHAESNSSGTQQVIVSDAACGCSTSAGNNSECDCEMQGTCFCDGSCTCKAKVCKEHSSSLR